MSVPYQIANIDLNDQVECVYREGAYEKRWMAPRYGISVVGYANSCRNEWIVPVESVHDLTHPYAAAVRVIKRDAPHRTVIGARLWDAKARVHFTIAA
ncbi:hypothetical protein SAMN05518849_101561 [Sphingobium sp. AP50]|uniref:hypothetical protein n=1 Tax=Sphingobium sp. AP50 TaxID=1884369 RepID=UPI0008CE2050|nr:hypothetical protein [Sphingobium sp. AP50]SEI68809.1 hypothetical protein SAMN05518849_101561 [Sphingobium sp. AP50]